MTLREFSEKDTQFKNACGNVKLPKTHVLSCGGAKINVNHGALGLKRQASKWMRQMGLAYKEGRV